jgi:acyl-CoA synthetase (AMP-forming)/AMP-acid ligase II
VVALLGPSNLDYLITIFSLTRLGYAILLLSNRLTLDAYTSLLEKTGSGCLVYSKKFAATVARLKAFRSYDAVPLLTRDDYTTPTDSAPFVHTLDRAYHTHKSSFIIHSSGSTGLPKPIFQTHAACLKSYVLGFGKTAFTTLPLYHNFGIANAYRSMFKNNEIYLYNANLPQTGQSLAEVIECAKPGILCAVPYTYKLLGETQRGIAALKSCDIVLSGGSACPEYLGNRLVEQGVNLVVQFGSYVFLEASKGYNSRQLGSDH